MAARPLVARQPNERLQALIQEAGCSNAGLARRVNMVGAERGLDLRYDKTSVARWLRGQQPRGRAPGIIAEALGRKLGRTVTIDEIGMANGKNLASGVGLQFSPDRPRRDRAGLRAVAQRRGAPRLPVRLDRGVLRARRAEPGLADHRGRRAGRAHARGRGSALPDVAAVRR